MFNIGNSCHNCVFCMLTLLYCDMFGRREKGFVPTCHTRVCSLHFVNSDIREGPKIFPWNASKLFQTRSPEKRCWSRRGKQLGSSTMPHPQAASAACLEPQSADIPTPISINPLELLADIAVAVTASSSTQSPESTEMSTVVSQLKAENATLRQQVAQLQSELTIRHQCLKFADIQDDTQTVSFFTGLPDKATFCVVRDLLARFPLQYHSEWNVSVDTLSLSEQLLLTLMKLRLRLKNLHLATHFGISTGTVTNVFITIISALYDILYVGIMCNTIPSQRKNAQCLPLCFTQFPNCRIIIDCTEISVDKAENLKMRCTTYSNYKSRTTLKALVGVSPNGVIVFVSDLYGGSTSDKQIVQNCNLFAYLEAGDMLMADKGFNIRQILPSGVTLNIPSFLYNGQFTKEEILHNKSIASARIHVERAIQRIKLFSILDHVPASLRQHADKIFKVCACLTNFQTPILAETESAFQFSSDFICFGK